MRKIKRVSNCLQNHFSIFKWLPGYKLNYLFSDVVAGITVGIYNVPQALVYLAMAYAILAGLPPVIGLYTSFFAPLLYAVFGTSTQVSVGMFSVTALMIGSVNDRFLNIYGNTTSDSDIKHSDEQSVQVATAMDFTIALVLGLMSVFRLHFIVAYMSNELVSGYTTGAAFHVVATQLPRIFGFSIPRHTGFLKLYYVLKDIVLSLKSTNFPDLITSVVCIIILHIGKWHISPRFKSRSGIPFPFELLVIIIATVLSTVLDAQKQYQMEVIANIPVGFPSPSFPAFSLMPKVIFDSIITAIVIFAITISICKVLCQTHSVNARQELFALAVVEFIISFFSCHPACGSLTRTVINSHCGAKSQLSSVISATLMAFAILWMAQLLESLPKCVLSAIIVVALQTMFLQVKQIKKLWKVSKTDMAIWLVGFFATVIWDVSQGLGIAVVFALITVVFRSQWPRTVQFVSVEPVLHKDAISCRETTNIPKIQRIMLYRFDAPLLFLNVDYFKKKIYRLVEASTISLKTAEKDRKTKDFVDEEGNREEKSLCDRYLVLDASAFCEIDYQGILCLKGIANDLRERYIHLIIAGAEAHILEKLKHCGIDNSIPKTNILPSVRSAINYAVENEFVSLHSPRNDGESSSVCNNF